MCVFQFISGRPVCVSVRGEDTVHAQAASKNALHSHQQIPLKRSFNERSFHWCFFRCDPGFSGPACELASQTFSAFLSESFSSVRLSSYHSFSSLRGAEVSFACGVLASGKALVFNRDSRRHIITTPLDSSQARYIEGGVFNNPVLFSPTVHIPPQFKWYTHVQRFVRSWKSYKNLQNKSPLSKMKGERNRDNQRWAVFWANYVFYD